jgi:hypothetical protein
VGKKTKRAQRKDKTNPLDRPNAFNLRKSFPRIKESYSTSEKQKETSITAIYRGEEKRNEQEDKSQRKEGKRVIALSENERNLI